MIEVLKVCHFRSHVHDVNLGTDLVLDCGAGLICVSCSRSCLNDVLVACVQEPDSRLWPYVYPNKYSEGPRLQEEDRWKDDRERERDRKGKEERQRPKEEVKDGVEGRTEEHRGAGKEARPPHMQFSSPLAQHQGYMPYMHGPYAYSHGYEPSHPGYRGIPSVMMQNYPGKKRREARGSPGGGQRRGAEGGQRESRGGFRILFM